MTKGASNGPLRCVRWPSRASVDRYFLVVFLAAAAFLVGAAFFISLAFS